MLRPQDVEGKRGILQTLANLLDEDVQMANGPQATTPAQYAPRPHVKEVEEPSAVTISYDGECIFVRALVDTREVGQKVIDALNALLPFVKD